MRIRLTIHTDKLLLALKCLNAAKELDPENPRVHENAIVFRHHRKSPPPDAIKLLN